VCPELDGINALADTKEEAISELEIVIGMAIDHFLEKGKPVPLPAKIKNYSGQFVVRLPKTIHERLVHQAKAEETSLNTLVVSYLSDASTQASTLNYLGKRLRRLANTGKMSSI